MHTYQAVIVVSGTQRCTGTTAYSRTAVAFIGPSPYPKSKAGDLIYPARCR
jgi:hypothetical protein